MPDLIKILTDIASFCFSALMPTDTAWSMASPNRRTERKLQPLPVCLTRSVTVLRPSRSNSLRPPRRAKPRRTRAPSRSLPSVTLSISSSLPTKTCLQVATATLKPKRLLPFRNSKLFALKLPPLPREVPSPLALLPPQLQLVRRCSVAMMKYFGKCEFLTVHLCSFLSLNTFFQEQQTLWLTVTQAMTRLTHCRNKKGPNLCELRPER